MGKGTEKKVSELIGEDVTIKWDGLDGTVSGEVKNVADFSEFFGESEKTGHFFPVAVDKKYKGKDLTASGRTGGDLTIHIDDDLMLIQRIENLTEAKKLTVKDGEDIVFTLDFTEATLAQE